MLTYEQKKALVLEIDQICEKQGEEHDRSVEMKDRYREKGKIDEWREWNKWATADLHRWCAYNEMLNLVVRRFFNCSKEDVRDLVHDLRKEQAA